MTENWEHFICKGTANISLLTFYDDRSQNVPAFPATNLKWLRGIAELTTTIQHHKFITRHLADTLPGYLSTLRALLCILNMTRPSQLSLQDTVQWVGRLADNLVFRGPIPDLFPFFMLKLILNVKKSVANPRVSCSVHTHPPGGRIFCVCEIWKRRRRRTEKFTLSAETITICLWPNSPRDIDY